ncbi:MAG TPA: hypothetical protein VGN63_20260 [Flavisolibacter sp.]|jgi:hypothetical protein|nr:hypothetical protein [Flavisolibacter sp.]
MQNQSAIDNWQWTKLRLQTFNTFRDVGAYDQEAAQLLQIAVPRKSVGHARYKSKKDRSLARYWFQNSPYLRLKFLKRNEVGIVSYDKPQQDRHIHSATIALFGLLVNTFLPQEIASLPQICPLPSEKLFDKPLFA